MIVARQRYPKGFVLEGCWTLGTKRCPCHDRRHLGRRQVRVLVVARSHTVVWDGLRGHLPASGGWLTCHVHPGTIECDHLICVRVLPQGAHCQRNAGQTPDNTGMALGHSEIAVAFPRGQTQNVESQDPTDPCSPTGNLWGTRLDHGETEPCRL
jgi:hypothetical protein